MPNTETHRGYTRRHAITRMTDQPAGQTDVAQGNGWAACAFLGDVHLRDNFSGAAADLEGHVPNEGGGSWVAPEFQGGRLRRDGAGGVVDSAPATAGERFGHINANVASGFFSVAVRFTATPATDKRPVSRVRLDAAGLNGYTLLPYTVDAEPGTLRLLLERHLPGVGFNQAFSQTFPVPAANDYWQLECFIRGSGTAADPTRIGCWVNGIPITWTIGSNNANGEFALADSNRTVRDIGARAQTLATQTRMGFGFTGSKAGATGPAIADLFVTSVPSNPGAYTPTVEASADIPLAPVAAGGVLPIKFRFVRRGVPLATTLPAPTFYLVQLMRDGHAVAAEDVLRDTGFLAISGNEGYVALSGWHATANGTAAGAVRCGTYRLRAVLKNDADAAGGGEVWRLDSDGAAEIYPVNVDNHDHEFGRGHFVASTTVTNVEVHNDVAGVNPSPGAVLPEQFKLRLALAHRMLDARSATINTGTPAAQRLANHPTFALHQDSQATAKATGQTAMVGTADVFESLQERADATYVQGSVGGRFFYPVSASGDPYLVLTAAPAGWRIADSTEWPGQTLRTGQRVTNELHSSSAGTAFTDSALTIDPRISVAHHLQLNNPTFALAAAVPSFVRLREQQGNVWAWFTNQRGASVALAGSPAASATHQLLDAFGSVRYENIDRPTMALADGKRPIDRSLLWDHPLPGGTWISRVLNVKLDGQEQHLIGADQSMTLLAVDAQVVVTAESDRTGHHFVAGRPLTLNLSMVRADNDPRIVPDTGDFAILRFTAAGQEHWTGSAWVTTGASQVAWLPAGVHSTDSRARQLVIPGSSTAEWGTANVLVVGRAGLSGSYFADQVHVELVMDSSNPESLHINRSQAFEQAIVHSEALD